MSESRAGRAAPPTRFPPRPRSFRGRRAEMATLAALVRAQHPTTIALVGGGGSGKSTLACALGHALSRHFSGRLLWVRIGAWDRTTVMQMISLQLGLPITADPTRAVRASLAEAPAFVVLDNHEDDATTAATLESLRGSPTTWIVTARRCLLGGVTLFPIVPALVSTQRSPFPSVARLTRLLRWHPVALDLADAMVTTGTLDEQALARRLRARGVDRIAPLDHEDDVPEVRGVVLEAIRHVSPAARRMLAVLAHMRGDHMDAGSLAALSGAGARAQRHLDALRSLRLVQEPTRAHFALHATVRYPLTKTLAFDEDAIAQHYLSLFEHRPERLVREQTHLFALMDWAQEKRDLSIILRVHELAAKLEARD